MKRREGIDASDRVSPAVRHRNAERRETDELGFQVASDKVHVHDLQATILHLLGLDHTKLIYHHQGRDYRLTDVHGELVHKILA